MSLAQTVFADLVSPRERGRYQGYIGAVFASSSIGGPVLGGVLSEHLHWSFIFWINLPLGLAALAMTSRALRRVPFRPRKHRLDHPRRRADDRGGDRAPARAQLGRHALSVAVMANRRARGIVGDAVGGCSPGGWSAPTEPFLPLTVLNNPVVRCASLSGACCMGVLVGLTIFVPLYFEVVRHLSASQSGLALIPMVGAVVIAVDDVRPRHGACRTLQAHAARGPGAGRYLRWRCSRSGR